MNISENRSKAYILLALQKLKYTDVFVCYVEQIGHWLEPVLITLKLNIYIKLKVLVDIVTSEGNYNQLFID